MKPDRIYLDYQATTPMDVRVIEAMRPYFSGLFGNASSQTHAWGWEAEAAVERARRQVADALGAEPSEICFTSGTTESNNWALKGFVEAHSQKDIPYLIVSSVEHPSVLEVAHYLNKRGLAKLTVIPTHSDWSVDLAVLESALAQFPDSPCMVSIIFVQNVVGTIQPVGEISKLCKVRTRAPVYFHTDATQAVGLMEIDVQKQGIDLMSLSGHKIYGPKGVGALFRRRKDPRVAIAPLLHGGGQENGARSGTLNVPGIVGLGAAAEICASSKSAEFQRLRGLSQKFWVEMRAQISDLFLDRVEMQGPALDSVPPLRGPQNLAFKVRGLESARIQAACKELGFSSGSACHSHLLDSPELFRVSFGRPTTEEEVERASQRIGSAINAELKTGV